MTQPPSSAKPAQPARSELRKTLLAQRRSTDPSRRQQWDAEITQQLLDWCQQHRPASLGVFWPIHAEPDLRGSYPLLQEMGIQLALPLVIAKMQPLIFLQWQPGESVVTDAHGIPVPVQRDRQLQPEALLIPCVGFNSDNFRLGYGGGFYDRSLAEAPDTKTVGVAYRQAQSEFTANTHDIAMDWVITEL